MTTTASPSGQRPRLDLGGTWTMRHFLEGEKNINTPDELLCAALDSIPAQVPGNVEIDLQAAGTIPDPFFGLNSTGLRPYEFHQYWYERHFTTPAFSDPELVFEGLDCIADVWLNGKKIASTDNALIPHRFSLRGKLRHVGEDNVLMVCLKSPLNAVRGEDMEPWERAHGFGVELLRLRKPAHCFGWDIMPRIVSAGIWRPVYIEDRPKNEIEDIYIFTERCDAGSAALRAVVKTRNDALVIDGFKLRLRGRCGDASFEHCRPLQFVWDQFAFTVSKPKLWWPRGYGEANLYEVVVELLHHDEVVASKTVTLGIRTVMLDHTELNTPEHPGRFNFIVNGVPVFIKGSNWVPADTLHSHDAARIPAILELFRDMGCNMARCWGGNVYEAKEFYDICDRYGIMIWQDFSMACAAYPQDEGFLARFRREAEIVVKERRQHACIALWAGDNENDSGYVGWWGLYRDPGQNRLTREVLPQVLQRLDPHRPYLPSSPFITPSIVALKGNERIGPEQHLWGPRDYYKSNFYANNNACFASETGYHGCPAITSLKKFISPDKLWPWYDNPEWAIHATDPIPGVSHIDGRIKMMADQTLEVFGKIPDNLDDFAFASQFVQAEAKKFFVENFRLRKGRTGGILWWNMMDGWPQISDAIVDYYFTKKLAYYFLKRVHKELCVMMSEPDSWHCQVVIGNDSQRERKGHFTVKRGEDKSVVLEGDFTSPANHNITVGRIRAPRSAQELYLLEWEADGERGANHYILGTPPFALEQWQRWLPIIRDLEPFEWTCN